MNKALMLVLCLFAATSFAADEETDSTQSTETAEASTTAQPEVTDSTEDEPGEFISEDFIPTVQISEDLSVSFPVDI